MLSHVRRTPFVTAVAGLLVTGVIAGCGAAATAHPNHPASGRSSTNPSGATSSSGMNMAGMIPLVTGANGTSATAAGLTLKADVTTMPADTTRMLGLTIFKANGQPVTSFDRDQTKLMHLIIVRRDLTEYQHIHPVLGAAGQFKVPLTLSEPGSYRAIADVTTAGKRYALGVTINVPGVAHYSPLAPASTITTVDGYQVHLQHGRITAGTGTQMTFTIDRAGKPVTALGTYLGTYGHLVALQRSTIAYSHVHPYAHDAAKGTITFEADLTQAATYRMFLQFRAAGAVHTAAFTVTAAA